MHFKFHLFCTLDWDGGKEFQLVILLHVLLPYKTTLCEVLSSVKYYNPPHFQTFLLHSLLVLPS